MGIPARRASWLAEAQRTEQAGNERGRTLHALYATHRNRSTHAAIDLVPATPGARLCWLGAGNANDIDLPALTPHFGQIHLVDLDPVALEHARARQPSEVQAHLSLHAPVDLTGLYAELDARPTPPATVADVEALIQPGTDRLRAQLPAGCDLVVSGCVMSQLGVGLRRQLGDHHPLLTFVENAMMIIHLRALVLAAAPGARCLIVNDLTNSDHEPRLCEPEAALELDTLSDRLIHDQRVFSTVNPIYLRRLLRHDPVLRPLVAGTRLGAPWLWTGAEDVTYLVAPLILERASWGARPNA
jgi:hypothetical protein